MRSNVDQKRSRLSAGEWRSLIRNKSLWPVTIQLLGAVLPPWLPPPSGSAVQKGKGRLHRPFGNQRCVRSVVAFAAGVTDGYAALATTGINTRIRLRHASAIQRLGCGVMLGVVIGSTGATVIGCVPFHCSFSRRGRCWSSDFSSRHWSGRLGRERIGQKRRSPDQRQKSRGFFTGRPTFAGYFFCR